MVFTYRFTENCKIDEAYDFLRSVAEKAKTVVFVGTKKQAQEAVKENRHVLCK